MIEPNCPSSWTATRSPRQLRFTTPSPVWARFAKQGAFSSGDNTRYPTLRDYCPEALYLDEYKALWLAVGSANGVARPEKERAEKSLIIIGLRNTKGDLTDAAVQKQMISEIIRGGKIANFPLNNYSEVASGKELRYIEVKAGITTG